MGGGSPNPYPLPTTPREATDLLKAIISNIERFVDKDLMRDDGKSILDDKTYKRIDKAIVVAKVAAKIMKKASKKVVKPKLRLIKN